MEKSAAFQLGVADGMKLAALEKDAGKLKDAWEATKSVLKGGKKATEKAVKKKGRFAGHTVEMAKATAKKVDKHGIETKKVLDKATGKYIKQRSLPIRGLTPGFT